MPHNGESRAKKEVFYGKMLALVGRELRKQKPGLK